MSADLLVPECESQGEFVSAELSAEPDKATLRNKIIIRTPEKRDYIPARNIALKLHSNAIYSDIPFSDKKWKCGADLVLDKPQSRVGLIAKLNGTLIVCAYASVDEYFTGEGGL